MKVKNLRAFQLFLLLALSGCNGQNPTNSSEELLSDDFDLSMPFDYKMPEHLSATDTSPAWDHGGQQILLTGTVYHVDGKTPAEGVVLYYYQTDINGKYTTKADEKRNMPKNKLGQTHGYIRGWVKTGADGKYAIYTTLPGSYPSRNEPAHVHIYISEDLVDQPYYIDDFVFDNDPLLTSNRRNKMENRAGSGVIRFVEKGELWIGERNLILGLNIPNYPIAARSPAQSGKNIGEDVTSFSPYHAFGPDKGTTTCPICKYGWYHGILYFVGNNPDWEEIKEWLLFLDHESLARQQYLKAYFIYGDESNYDKNRRIEMLEKLGTELQLQSVALTFVSSFSDVHSDIYSNKINQNVDNTFIIYRRSNIIAKYVNLPPTAESFERIRSSLESSTNEYFKLSRPISD